MKRNTKQTVHAEDGRKISVSAVIFFLLTVMAFFTAMGMIAFYCYIN